MKKIAFRLAVAAIVLLSAFSCTEKVKSYPIGGGSVESDPLISGIYILNSGKEGSNNTVLSYFDVAKRELSANVFELANGKKLGDTGNDIIIYGSKMYIAVTGSSRVFVTDLKGYLLKEIAVEGESANLSPRKLIAAKGKVYVSFMEGYVGAIDTAGYNVQTVKVGPMPEGLAYANNKIYVANSDGYNYQAGYGTTVSVIDVSSFTVKKTIEVANNPQTLYAVSDSKVYLISLGDYGEIPEKLQKINTNTDTVTEIPDIEPTDMAIGKDGIAYILSKEYDEKWNAVASYTSFDTVKDKVIGELVSSADVPNGYTIFTDKVTGDIYIGTSDYISSGDLYVVTPDGQVVTKFDTGGLNPIAICTVE